MLKKNFPNYQEDCLCINNNQKKAKVSMITILKQIMMNLWHQTRNNCSQCQNLSCLSYHFRFTLRLIKKNLVKKIKCAPFANVIMKSERSTSLCHACIDFIRIVCHSGSNVKIHVLCARLKFVMIKKILNKIVTVKGIAMSKVLSEM